MALTRQLSKQTYSMFLSFQHFLLSPPVSGSCKKSFHLGCPKHYLCLSVFISFPGDKHFQVLANSTFHSSGGLLRDGAAHIHHWPDSCPATSDLTTPHDTWSELEAPRWWLWWLPRSHRTKNVIVTVRTNHQCQEYWLTIDQSQCCADYQWHETMFLPTPQ